MDAPIVPDGAIIVVADAKGYIDAAMRGKPFMWCWIDGPTWYYIKDFPIPIQGRKHERQPP